MFELDECQRFQLEHLILPRSTRPVTTVPRPEMVMTFDCERRFIIPRVGAGTKVSTASINSTMCFSSAALPSKANLAEPRMTGTSSLETVYLISHGRPFRLSLIILIIN